MTGMRIAFRDAGTGGWGGGGGVQASAITGENKLFNERLFPKWLTFVVDITIVFEKYLEIRGIYVHLQNRVLLR